MVRTTRQCSSLSWGWVVTVAIMVPSCKHTSASGTLASVSDPNSDAELEPYKVIDCTPELCSGNRVLLPFAQDPADQTIAMELNQTADPNVSYALDGTPATTPSKKENSAGAKKLDDAAALANLARDLMNSNGKSITTQFSLGSLMASLNPMLQTATEAETFASNNIDGTFEQREKTLLQMKALSGDMGKYTSLGASNRDQLLTQLEVLAGQDGWLNYGDMPRITAVIPQIVGRMADQRIAGEVPGKIAQYSAYYRSQLPLGGLFFGGMVDDQVTEKVMSAAYGMKWQAVNQAATGMQTQYSSLMSSLGVQSYYLLAHNQQQKYWDPAPQVTESQLEALVESMTGQSIESLLVKYQSASQQNSNASILPAQATATIRDISSKIVLPDGLPIQEIHRLFKVSGGFTKVVFPQELRFKTLADGRLEIRRNTAAIDLGNVVSKNDTTNSQGNPSQGDFSCTGITRQTGGNQVSVFLYSGMEGKRLSMLTEAGWFEMMTPNNAQPPVWLTVRSGNADAGWLKATQIRIRLEANDGTFKTCLGKLYHM